MYRLIKRNGAKIDVLAASRSEQEIFEKMEEYMSKHPVDLEYPLPDTLVRVDSVNEMSDEEVLRRSGGFCVHCHSDQVETKDIAVESGRIVRRIACSICNEDTNEAYSFSGIVRGEEL